MSELEQAARLALELCDRIIDGERVWSLSDMREVSTALRAALAKQAEPVVVQKLEKLSSEDNSGNPSY